MLHQIITLADGMPPRATKGKLKAEPDADVEDEAPAAKKPKGKQKAEPDADVEDEAPAAKKTKPEKVKKKPMRRPVHGMRAARPFLPCRRTSH